MTLPIPKSVIRYGDTYYTRVTKEEVFTPLTLQENEVFLIAVDSLEKKHKRRLTKNELLRLGDIVAGNGS